MGVNREELAALEAAASNTVETGDAAASSHLPVVDSGDGEELKTALSGAVGMLSIPVCNRYRVTQLRKDECAAAGAAIYGVLQAYGLLDRADPRVMAVLAAAGVAMQIVGGRELLPPPADPQPAHAAAA